MSEFYINVYKVTAFMCCIYTYMNHIHKLNTKDVHKYNLHICVFLPALKPFNMYVYYEYIIDFL